MPGIKTRKGIWLLLLIAFIAGFFIPWEASSQESYGQRLSEIRLAMADNVPPPASVPPGLPDLQVVDDQIIAGRLTFSVINRGDAVLPAGQTFDYLVELPGQGQSSYRTFYLFSDFVPIPTFYLSQGPPYPSEYLRSVEVEYLVTPCFLRDLTITVNPYSMIPELDYANNRFVRHYPSDPFGSCGPRLKLYSAQSVSLPSSGSPTWRARLWIKNLGNAPASQVEIKMEVYGVTYAPPGSFGVPPNFNYRIISTKDYSPVTVEAGLQPGVMRLVDVSLPVADLPSGFPSCSIVAAQIVGVPDANPPPPIETPHRVWVFPTEWNGMSGDGGVIPPNYPNAPGCVGFVPPGPVSR